MIMVKMSKNWLLVGWDMQKIGYSFSELGEIWLLLG
jgi:hypothetical protein